MFHETKTLPKHQHYYLFGLMMPGRSWSDGYRYGFNGKEQDAEGMGGNGSTYDYGFRIYNPAIAKFLSVDPLTRKYSYLTPYQFASNSPISGIDLDGLEYFYAADGTYLGKTGTSLEVRVLSNRDVSNNVAIQGIKNFNSGQINDETWNAKIQSDTKSLGTNIATFKKYTATAYGESSVGNGAEIKEEVWGIASAMVNFKMITGKNSLAFAATDGNDMYEKFMTTDLENANGTFMQTANAGAINALTGGIDYSNGGTHWAGNDIGSGVEKWSQGLNFTDKSHDLFGLGNNSKPGEEYWYDISGNKTSSRGKWEFKWETTAAYGEEGRNGNTTGTTFMKVTDDYKSATGNKGQ